MLIDTDEPDAPERDVAGETIEVAARSAVLIIGIHKVETP
jgi:hypothetical protein